MATVPETPRGATQWATDFWTNTSTATKLVLAGVVVLLAAALGGMAFLAREETEGRVALLEGYRFTSDESRSAIQAFGTANLSGYEYAGGQIFVPRSKVNEYLQALAGADSFRDNFDKPIDDYVNNQRTWWASQSDAERLLLIAKQKTLSRMIASMDGVEEAAVVFAAPERLSLRRVGKGKATVTVTAYKPISSSQSETIRNMVANSFQELDPSQVFVAVTNKAGKNTYSMSKGVDTELAKSKNEYLQTKEAYAELVESDVRRLLSDLDGVEVVANVDLEPQYDINQQITSWGKGAIASQDTSSRNSEVSTPAGGGGGEPGARTNADIPGQPPATNQGVAASAAVSTNVESDETSSTNFQNNRVETTQRVQGLIPRKVAVVVNIPRQYFEATTDAAGQPVPPARTEQDVTEMITKLGYPGLTAESVKIVRITPPVPPEEPAASNLAAMRYVKEYGSSVLYAVLGFAAVLAALIVVRRSALPTIVKPAEEDKEAGGDMQEDLLPPVPESESAIRYEQIKDAVGGMVTTDPDGAASLVRRWLAQDE